MIHLPHLQRRDFLSCALASFPLALLRQSYVLEGQYIAEVGSTRVN